MAKNTDKDNDSAFNPLDLSQLKDLSFGPDWASESGKKRSEQNYRQYDGTDRQSDRPNRRSGGGRGSKGGHRGEQREQRDRRGGVSRRENRGEQEPRNYTPFEPTVDVIFVSQDKPFEVLLKAMRTTFKTYELFEIARIILAKENRFIAIISPREDVEEKKIFVSVPDQLPFDTREDAINHVMNHHLERFFEISEVEVEPPSGNFQMVNRCKLTGELLAPPNFHRYQDILKEHYAKHISNLSFERFLERVESVKDPEIVQQWIDKMKITRQYTLKQKEDDTTKKVVLSALEDVRYYLTTERRNEVFLAKDKVRLPGEKIELLPRGDIRRSIELELENQKRFPLITSNHLRGRLRRCNLNFFKKGSKGITYVCAVKRKPRYKDTIFSETIQKLIDYVEKHPKILVEDLLKDYLPEGVEAVTEETQKAVALDLHWLIAAGYVSEFGNGELLAESPLPINASEDKNLQQHTTAAGRKGGKQKSAKTKKTDRETPAAEASASTESAADASAEAIEESTTETEIADSDAEKVEEASAEAPIEVADETPEAVDTKSEEIEEGSETPTESTEESLIAEPEAEVTSEEPSVEVETEAHAEEEPEEAVAEAPSPEPEAISESEEVKVEDEQPAEEVPAVEEKKES